MPSETRSTHASSEARRWRFGWCEFIEISRQLVVHGAPVRLEAKPADVLLVLLERPGLVLTKDELIGAAWSHTQYGASDASLTTAIRKLRTAFGGGRDDIILTVPGLGYRMAVPVVEAITQEAVPSSFRLKKGDIIPFRPHWQAERFLGLAEPATVWLAEHTKTREVRVFKFAVDGVRLRALQKEVTLSRLLQRSLLDGSGFVRIIDWNLEETPFFTESEYGGLNLREWAFTEDFAQLTLAERVAVATELAEAIASAHALGILHNDLKPTNVLVTERGEGQHSGEARTWQVKVADFGVAWLSQPERLREMEITEHGFAGKEDRERGTGPSIGTGMYRAPETMNVFNASPDVLADIYALGVILYQLVCGDFLEPPLPGWEKRIEDPLLREDIAEAANVDPSSRISSASALAERLRTLTVRRAIRCEQEQVSAAALRAEQELAAARLRRPWVILALLALCIGVTLSLVFAYRAGRARDSAVADAARAKRIEEFTEGLFTDGESGAPSKALTVENLLARGVRQAQGLKSDPVAQADLLQTLGNVYSAIGFFEKSDELLQSALRSREKVFGRDSPQSSETLVALSAARGERGQVQEALVLAQRALNIDLRRLPENDPQTFRARIRVASAWIDVGDYSKSVPLLKELIREGRNRRGEEADLSDAINELGLAEVYLGHPAEAQILIDEADALDRKRLGDKHASIGAGLISRSQIQQMQGHCQQAESDARAALDIFRGWFEPDHFEISSAETTLADALACEGKANEALPLLTDSARIQQLLFAAAPNEKLAHTFAALGRVAHDLHRQKEALEYYKRAEGQYRVLFQTKDYRLGSMLYNESRIYSEESRWPQAEAALREALEIQAARLPVSDKRLLDVRLALGEVLLREARPMEAKPLFSETYKQAVSAGPLLQEERDRASRALERLSSTGGVAPAKQIREPH